MALAPKAKPKGTITTTTKTIKPAGHRAGAPTPKANVTTTTHQPIPLTRGEKVGNATKTTAAGIGSVGSGVAGAATKGDGQGVVIMIGVAFIILTVAKIQGIATFDWKRALLGGFILTFMLMLLARWSSKVALGFAALVLIQVLVEYGVPVLANLQGKTVNATASGGTTIAATGPYTITATGSNLTQPTTSSVQNRTSLPY